MARHRGHNEGTIYERAITRKDGTKVTRYVVQLPIDEQGKRPQLGSFKTKGEAKEALRSAEVAKSQGMLVTDKAPTVQAWCDQWLAGRTRISYGTRAAYTTSFHTIMPYIGHVRLDKLREMDLAAMWKKLGTGEGADGKPRRPLAETTVDRCYRHLKAALRAATMNRQVPLLYNPASASEAKPPKGERLPIHPLTEEDVQRLFAATRGDREYPLWITLITTGMRPGEAQALRWQNIDFERRTLAVCSSLHRERGNGWVAGPTKTKRNRVVRLRPQALDALKRHRTRQAEMRLKAGALWEDHGYVFTTETGKPLNRQSMQAAFDRACERVGIDRRKLKECRHTFATLGLMSNVPVKIISDALGHATAAITYDVYAHVIAQWQEDSMSYLDRLFN